MHPVTLGRETRDVAAKDDPRYGIGSAPIRGDGASVPVIMLVSHQRCHMRSDHTGMPITITRLKTYIIDGIRDTGAVPVEYFDALDHLPHYWGRTAFILAQVYQPRLTLVVICELETAAYQSKAA